MAWIESHKPKRKHLRFGVRKEIYLRDGGKCQICYISLPLYGTKSEMTGRARIVFHIDHIITVKDGGSNHPKNLRLTCTACNEARNKKNKCRI